MKKVKAMPTTADHNMIEAAYMLIETMPKGTPERHKKIVAEVWDIMCQFAPTAKTGGLTPRMRQGLETICDYIDENGTPPTYLQIAKLMNRQKSDIHGLVHALRRRGFIDFKDRKFRSIRILIRPGEPSPNVKASRSRSDEQQNGEKQ